MAEDISGQLKMSQQLAATLTQVAETLDRINKNLESQAERIARISQLSKDQAQSQNQNAKGILNVLDDLDKKYKKQEESLEEYGKRVEKSLKTANDALELLPGSMKNIGESLVAINEKGLFAGFLTSIGISSTKVTGFKKQIIAFSKAVEKLGPGMMGAIGFVSGLADGLSNLGAIAKVSVGILGGIADAIFNIGAAIISIPFKMFNGLIDMANKAGMGGTELLQAIEDLRKQFGALYGPTNKTISGLAVSMKGFSDTGLSAWRVFGNMAHRLNELRELATTMGPTFSMLTREFQDNGGALLAYQKGLGLSNEQMKVMGDRAITMGESLSDSLKEVTKYSIDMGKAFNMDAKVISRDMGKAAADVKHFANSSAKELGIAVVYARKLGVELEKIVGVMDSFESFDSAAENTAKLSQSFGVQVDAFKMMSAQNPAEQIEMLRDAMKAAGQDSSNFNRQQLKLLQSTLGLDEATTKQVFSQKNAGMSLREIQAQASKSEKKTLSQAEAMQKLADSIERLVQSAGGRQGGFFDRFFHGFLGGIQASKEFRDIIFNINRGLWRVEMIGVQLGRSFMKIFPQFSKFFGAIGEFFEPNHIAGLFTAFSGALSDFFKDISSGKNGFEKLMKRLKDVFFDFFDQKTGPGRKLIESFKDIAKIISRVFGEMITWIGRQVAAGLHDVASFLRNPREFIEKMKAGAAKGESIAAEILGPIAEALLESAPLVWDALKDVFSAAWEKLKEFLTSKEVTDKVIGVLPYIFGVVFGPAAIKGAFGFITGALVKGVIGAFKKNEITNAVSEGANALQSATQNIKGVGGSEGLSGAAKDVGAVSEIAKEAEKGSKFNLKKIGETLLLMAGVVTIGLAAFYVALEIIKDKSAEEIMKAAGVLLATSAALLPLTLSIMLLSKAKINASGVTSVLTGLLTIVIVIEAMAGTAILLTKTIGNLDKEKLTSSLSAMFDVSKVFLMAAGVVLASLAIGGIVSATGGLVGAAIIATGLGIIVTVISAMAVAAHEIMKKLNELTVSAGFKEKADAFVGIVNAITNFASSISGILDVIKPGFFESNEGAADKMTSRIVALGVFLSNLVGQPGGAGLIGLVETIINATKHLAGGDRAALEGAKTFSELLSAVASLATALKPSDQLTNAVGGWFTSSTTVVENIKKTGEFAGTMGVEIEKMIRVVKDVVMPLVSQSSDIDQNKIASISSLMNIVGAVSQALQPSPGTLAMLQKTEQTFLGGRDTSLDPVMLGKLTEHVEKTSKSLKDFMPVVFSSLEPLIKAIKGAAFNDSDVAVLKVIGPMLQQLFAMISSISAQSSQIAQAKIPGLDLASYLDQIANAVPTMLDKITATLPIIFAKLKTASAELSKSKLTSEDIKKVTDMLAAAGKLLNSASDLSSTKIVESLGTSLNTLTVAGVQFEKIIENAKNIVTRETQGKITEAVKSVEAMIKAMNDLDELLSGNANIVDVNAKLGNVAKSAGLGAQKTQTINNKAVQVTVNLNVTMSAVELEKIMITQKKSIIKDRLNFIGENVPDISKNPGYKIQGPGTSPGLLIPQE